MVEITLLRAARLQSAIKEVLKALEIKPRATASIFADVAATVASEHAKLGETLGRQERLVGALFDIRRATARANIAAGIADVLADQAENDLRIDVLTTLATAKPFEGLEVNMKRAERLQKRDDAPATFGRQSAAEVYDIGILTEAEIEGYRVQLLDLKKRRAEFKDRLAELNAGTRLELSEATVSTLKAEHLL